MPRVERQEERTRGAQTDTDAPVASMWPLEAVVNSQQHLYKYAPKEVLDIFDRTLLRSSLPIDKEVERCSSERLVQACCAGVLCPNSILADSCYALQSLSLAETGRASFVAGGPLLVYGANVAADRVLLPSSLRDHWVLRQACGRAGRQGKCNRAEVLFVDWDQARTALHPTAHARVPMLF